jgi:hypothetical protein
MELKKAGSFTKDFLYLHKNKTVTDQIEKGGR